jgi:predicted ATPase
MAAALERRWGDQSAAIANQLALLFESAREFARAADYFRLAAQHAAALFASQEAVVLARLALAMIEAMPPGRDRRERELSVQIVLGNALMATRGYAAPEVEATYTRAEALCREIGETPHALPVLFGVFGYQVVRANLRTALDVGVEFLRRTERRPGPSVLIGHRLAGGASLYLGELNTARRHLAEATRQYDRVLHRPLTWLYGQEPGTVVFSLLAIADWLLGYPDRALASSEEALRIGREISHAHTHAQLLTFTAMHHQLRRDWSRVGELARALADLAAEQGMPFWSAAALPLRASVLTAQGRAPEAVADLQRGIETMKVLGAELFRPYSLYMLADALGQAGDVAGALEALDRADLTMQQHDERWWEPEQLRLRGELLARLGIDRRPEADACVWRAVEIARAREAKSLELRAVTSLARLRAQTDRRDEARVLLARTYGWFAEGLESADLIDAKAALAAL